MQSIRYRLIKPLRRWGCWLPRWTTVLRHLVLLTVMAIIVLPFLWVILMSFRPYRDLTLIPPTFLPRIWTLENYHALFARSQKLLFWYMNSVIVNATVVPIMVLVSCFAGYSFARIKFPGRDAIFWVMVSTIFLPLGFPRLFSIFEMTWRMGLMDNIVGLILPYLSMGLVVYIFIMRGIFLEIPQELEDAALIDGCSVLGTLRHIVIPLSAPGLVIVAVLCFLETWGEFMYAATLTFNKGMTLPVALAVAVVETQGDTVMTTLATAYVLAMIPPVIVYLMLNRSFRAGLMSGALKF